MKKKIIALVTALLMIMCMIPSVAFAGSYTINSSGSYTMSSFGYASGDNITIGNGLTVALIGDSTTMYTNFWISCGAGVTLTISNVNIDDSTNNYVSPLTFTGSGNTLILADGTSNTLIGGAKRAGICVEEGTELTIRGNGTLNAVGNGFEEESETNGSAGIGGNDGNSSGIITIAGGTINATADEYGAGIGGGNGGNGIVIITGGTVTATGGILGAGIGGGYGTGTVNISGGTVIATGGSGATGIGGGGYGNGDVTITGGTVTATGGSLSAGIGGGRNAIGTVNISGATVNAAGGTNATGIGGGVSGDGEVTITGGTVNATGGSWGSGIGSSRNGSGDITITGGTVFASYGSSELKDIDSGTAGSDNSVIISDSAALILRHDTITPPSTTTHTHLNYSAGTTTVYGVDIPSVWTDTFGAYLRVCTLSYDANGGSDAPSEVSQLYGTKVLAASGSGITKGAYTFTGWNSVAGGSGTAYAAGGAYTFTGTETLFAQWDGTDVTVASNNASYGSVAGGGEYEPGTGVTVTATVNLTYFFAGWYDGDTLVSSNASYTFTAGDDVSLTAEFGAGISLVTASLPKGMKGNAYNFTASAENGTTPYQWSAEGLPNGLLINGDTGQITGTPTGRGSFDVTLTVTDENSMSDEKTLTLFINDRCGNGGYIITPETNPNFTWDYGTGGLPTLTVSSGITGFKTFSVSITPYEGHAGSEALLFVHMRDKVMISIAANFADYDTIGTGKAAFNVKPGDIIMVYIVDDIGSDASLNPNIL